MTVRTAVIVAACAVVLGLVLELASVPLVGGLLVGGGLLALAWQAASWLIQRGLERADSAMDRSLSQRRSGAKRQRDDTQP